MPSPLGPAFVAQVQQLKAVLAPVYPRSLDEWLEGFRLDAQPGRELWLWQCMAMTWQGFVEARELDLAGQKDVLQVVLGCSLGYPLERLVEGNDSALSVNDIREIHTRFCAAVDAGQATSRACSAARE